MKGLTNICLTALVFLFGWSAQAQTSVDLKKKRSNLQKQIEYTNNLLNETRGNQRMSQTELILLNKQISLREEKISSLSYQLTRLDNAIGEKQAEISASEVQLEQLREEYAQMVVNAWKNRNNNEQLLYIFAADDLDQAYKRLKYMQNYVSERENLKNEILALQETIKGEIASLEDSKTERVEILGLQKTDKLALAVDQKEQEQTYKSLIANEQKLRAQLRAQERDKDKLNQAIAYAIRKEIEKEKNKNSGTFKLTPEAKIVSTKFEKNKGTLPWPVERGVITSSFGEHPHPTISGLKIQNNGVDIATNKEAKVRAIFEGEVISVIVISGAGKTVMVQHGGYYTAYSNLKDVYVKKGDKVTTKQELGKLLPDSDTGKKSVSHFEIWKVSSSGSMTKENPALWIYNR